jgi:hypothetical protein
MPLGQQEQEYARLKKLHSWILFGIPSVVTVVRVARLTWTPGRNLDWELGQDDVPDAAPDSKLNDGANLGLAQLRRQPQTWSIPAGTAIPHLNITGSDLLE